VKVDAAGNVYVTGLSWGSGSWQDYATVKYNSSGVQQWEARYNGPANNWDWAYQMVLDNAANVYVTGFSVGSGTDRDYATVKYNSSGVQQWVIRYNGTVNFTDEAKAVGIDTARNIYVTGFSYGLGVNYDYVTIKYSQMVGIQPVSNEIPKSYELFQNYPNPFNPVTRIKFDIPPFTKGGQGGFVTLIIYDILGREATTLVSEQLKPGTYEVEFDGTSYPSGIYFYRLFNGEFVRTKKMILAK
jgi:hypothetical protein